ncbi:MAG: DJ-1/PfpI family protein [Bernardetiaceae bacterium]
MTLLKFGFYLHEGIEVLDFSGPMEVFSQAGYALYTFAVSQKTITSQGVLDIIPRYTLDTLPPMDWLCFFGGNSQAASQNPQLLHWLAQQKPSQQYFSVCTGAYILARAGLLNGKEATTFAPYLADLQDKFPAIAVVDRRFVDTGSLITSAGVAAGIDAALHLVARLEGHTRAAEIAAYMAYPYSKSQF